MRLVFTTDDFVFAGRPRPGFPLILGDDMEPAQPFDEFLTKTLLESGRALDVKTWEAYGRRLWDFARFLHDNELTWDQPFESPGRGVVRVYRDWQALDLGLEPATVNKRLRKVVDFYEWARRVGLIDRLPFTRSEVDCVGIEHDFRQVNGGRVSVSRPDILIDEWDKEPLFLTAAQVAMARSSLKSASQRLLFDLMVRVGLRSAEARTFPVTSVFDPTCRKDLRPDTMLNVRLDPAEMETKFSKPRVVHVPFSLMQDMYQYTLFERNRYLRPRTQSSTLLLTTHGNAYDKGAVWKVVHDLGCRVGFGIHPHMLRHSYAVHTLLFLKDCKNFNGDPLMYLRDRLGHRSVQSTMVYLRQIERLGGGEAQAMMAEFDRLYDVSSMLRTSAPAERSHA